MKKWFNLQVPNRTLLLTLILMLCVSMSAAQETPDDAEAPSLLMQLLAHVPNIEAARENMLGYADFVAARDLRPGLIDAFENLDTFKTVIESDQKSEYLNALPVTMGAYRNYLLQWSGVLGFDFLAIEQALMLDATSTWDSLDIFRGAFDSATIESALTAIDFVPVEQDGAVIWCGDSECDGRKTDINRVEIGNPFGGWLGRRQPMTVSDSFVISSMKAEVIWQIVNPESTDTRTLADEPDYQAIDYAVHHHDADARLRQLYFVPVSVINREAFMPLTLDEAALAALEEAKSTAVALPAYRLAALADLATAETQIFLLTLVYTQESSAQEALEVLTDRYHNLHLPIVDEYVHTGIEKRGGEFQTPYIADAENGVYAVVLPIHYPQITAEDVEDKTQSSLMYSYILNLIYRDTLDWIRFD